MDPFHRFGIDHLSASSLNLYSEEPAYWTICYLHGHHEKKGPRVWRGSAVESGLDHWLYKRDLPEALQVASARFELEALGDLSDDVHKEREFVPQMLQQAVQALQAKPEPTARQLKIEL